MEKLESSLEPNQPPADETLRPANPQYEVEDLDCRLDTSSITSLSLSSQTIKVYLRMKPFPLKMTVTKAQEDAYRITSSTTLLAKLPGPVEGSTKKPKATETLCRKFVFTKTFGPETTQLRLFEEAAKQQTLDFLSGHSSTLMSYGTTNAGKSYTLLGTMSSPGIIPFAIDLIFSQIGKSPFPFYKPVNNGDIISLGLQDRSHEMEMACKLLSPGSMDKNQCIEAYKSVEGTMRENDPVTTNQSNQANYSVWVSFAEIYNETIYDLLSNDCQDKKPMLKMVTDRRGRTFIKGLKMVCVNSGMEAYQILMLGQCKLNVAATSLNARSSRSHCIFTIKLLKYFKENAPEEVSMSSLSFCDLAGSGRLKKSLNFGKCLKETQNINTSMLVFGRCLKAIWEGQSVKQKTEVVGPFRESKLTRLFQRALSGKERIALIVNVNPVPNLYVETQSVLNFSAIAKKIVVEPMNQVKRKTLASRFSQLISQSVKTVTDWDSTGLESRIQSPEKSEYIVPGKYDESLIENETLRKEITVLKNSALNREFEIRQEMTSIYTGMVEELENSWKSHVKGVEERQEEMLSWSVHRVENFYKEKMSQLDGRKRRRMDNGYRDNESASVEELEAENSHLTATIVSLKESIKELRDTRKKLFTDKNKGAFELALVKDELQNTKSMLEAAHNDIRHNNGADCLIEKLQKQLHDTEDCVKTLKELLNEAKEDYISITSDSELMRKKLKEMRTTLLENSEKIENLREQNEQSNISLMKQTKHVERLKGMLELKSKELANAANTSQDARYKYSKSEKDNSTLMKKLDVPEHDAKQTLEFHKLSIKLVEVTNETEKLREMLVSRDEMVAELTSKLLEAESENLPLREKLQRCNREIKLFRDDLKSTKVQIEDVNGKIELLKDIECRTVETSDAENQFNFQTDIIERVEKENQTSFRYSDTSSKDDSGIVITAESGNQTMELIDTTNGSKTENEENTSQVNFPCEENSEASKLEITEYKKTLILIEKETESVRAGKEEREKELAEAIKVLEAKVSEYENNTDELRERLKVSQERESRTLEDLDEYIEKSDSLESQLSVAYVQLDKVSIKCFTEHVPKIQKLENEISDARSQEDLQKQSIEQYAVKVSKLEEDLAKACELKEQVAKFENTLAECRKEKDKLQQQLVESFEKLLSLERELKEWVQEKEDEILSLQTELRNIVESNKTNNESLKEMEKDIEDALTELTATEGKLCSSEEARRTIEQSSKQEIKILEERLTEFAENAAQLTLIQEDADIKQSELDRLRMELDKKEHEMNVFSKNKDETIQRYEALVKQLQEDCNIGRLEVTRIQKLFLKQKLNKAIETLKEGPGPGSTCPYLPQDKVQDQVPLEENRMDEEPVVKKSEDVPAIDPSDSRTMATNKLIILPTQPSSISLGSPEESPLSPKTLLDRTDEVHNEIGERPVAAAEDRSLRKRGITSNNYCHTDDLSGSELKRSIGRTIFTAPSESMKANRKVKLIIKTDEVRVDLEPNDRYALPRS